MKQPDQVNTEQVGAGNQLYASYITLFSYFHLHQLLRNILFLTELVSSPSSWPSSA